MATDNKPIGERNYVYVKERLQMSFIVQAVNSKNYCNILYTNFFAIWLFSSSLAEARPMWHGEL